MAFKSTLFSGQETRDSKGLKYMTSHDEMHRFLTDKFGKARHISSQSDALAKRGIVFFESVKSLHGGSHVDLWDGKDTTTPATDYFGESKNVWLWELGSRTPLPGGLPHGHQMPAPAPRQTHG